MIARGDALVRHDRRPARFDDEGRARPELEQALTEGIANVPKGERAELCFATGHGEASLDDVGPEGSRRAVATASRRATTRSCPLNLERRRRQGARGRLSGGRGGRARGPHSAGAGSGGSPSRRGGGIVLLRGPGIRRRGASWHSGLERVGTLSAFGSPRSWCSRTTRACALPRGAGEVFFANPVAHAVTRGLAGGRQDRVSGARLRGAEPEARRRARTGRCWSSSQQALSVATSTACSRARGPCSGRTRRTRARRRRRARQAARVRDRRRG